jgi:DNA repair photolyase
MNIREISVKTILSKSKLPESTYSINPYIGCMHGCIYCYARFVSRFTGHKERWGEYLDIKINGVSVLEKDLKKIKLDSRDIVLLSSITDPYLPIEQKYRLTRSILEVLLKHQISISILTKSDLVLRDIDLFTKFKNCEVGLTIITMDEYVSKVFEPRAPSPSRRLKALKILKEHGIKTYAFIGPILPCFTNLREIFSSISGIVDDIMAESLNIKCGNWKSIQMALQENFPSCAKEFSAKVKDVNYWNGIGKELMKLSSEFNIPLRGYYRH